MKLIDISTPKYPNTFAMVDDDDFDWLNQWKWYPMKNYNTTYVTRDDPKNPRIKIRMHRMVAKPTDGERVDHRDRNGLNNTRGNLRIATESQNSCNRLRRIRSKSGYIGVYSRYGKWVIKIAVKGIPQKEAWFQDPVEAAKARDVAALELHGEFAVLNFPNLIESYKQELKKK